MPTTQASKGKLELFLRPIADARRCNPHGENRTTAFSTGVEAIKQFPPPRRAGAVLLVRHSRHSFAFNDFVFRFPTLG